MADNQYTEYLAYNIIQKMYYPNEIENKYNEEYIMNKYSMNDSNLIFGANNDDDNDNNDELLATSNYSYIEIPDRLTNINGSHIYKLISSKDIDWENVLLNYSAVPNSNWGDFDEQRRWSNTDNGKAITINDVYELMNVIDYLLCSCENLWDEINKLKYNKEVEKLLFYVINADDADVLSLDSNQIKEIPEEYKTYLDPYNNDTFLTNSLSHFGMATEIYHDTAKYMLYCVQEGKGQIIPGIALNDTKQYSSNPSSFKTKNGISTIIYGNNLYNEIRLYPGSNIYNFINNRQQPLTSIIDTENKKFKYENVYCADYLTNNNTIGDIPFFREVYIDFYKSDNNEYNNYMIYYLENDIKYIIYKIGDMPSNPHDYQNNNQYNIRRINDYDFSNENTSNIFSPLQKLTLWNNSGELLLYTFSDEYSAKFRISTQGNISSIPTMSIDINLKYYKRQNTINSNIYIKENNNEETLVKPIVDMNEENNILYNNTKLRYNIPSNLNILIKTTASYLDTNNKSANENNQLLLDNVYEDIMLYKIKNNNNTQYVDQYNNIIDNTQNLYTVSVVNKNNTKELQFTQKTVADYGNFIQLNDSNDQDFAIIYKKIENPYKLSYSLDVNTYLLQEEKDFNNCKRIINDISNSIQYNPDTSELSFSYDLQNLEQIKFNLNLSIDETPKIKGISYTLPINLNKIYYPTINFISNSLVNEELNNYDKNNLYKKIVLSSTTRSSFDNNSLGIRYDRYDYDSNNNSSYYKLLSKIFTYEYDKKKDIIGNHYDLISLLYGNNDDINYSSLSYKDEITYNINYNSSGINKNSYFMTYYDISYSYISLLGSYFTKKVLPTNEYLTYFTYIDNNTHAYYMFNIYNLSANYRPKGGDDTWMINDDQSPNIVTNFEQYRYYTHYSSYANSVKNNLNNLAYFIDVNIYNDGFNQTYKENIYSNTIKSERFEIFKDQFKLYNFNEEISTTGTTDPNSFTLNNSSISYVPILSMHLLKSTFNPGIIPNSDTIDGASYFDLNNSTNYSTFINIWDSSEPNNNTLDKYFTSTIKLQLMQNRTRDLPFFEQSNIAETNIKILRKKPLISDTTTEHLLIRSLFDNDVSQNKILYFDINKKYYMADLFNISQNDRNVVIGCLPYKIGNNVHYTDFIMHQSSITQINDNIYIL